MVTFYRGLCVLVMMSRACLAHGTVATNQDAEMNYNAPADVTINQQIVASNPGAFSASSAYNFNNFVVGAFEPLIFRTKILAVDGTDKNTLLAGDNVLDEYDTWRDGLLDNASVRVYRVMNGSFVLVRNDTIARYRCSGWSGLLNGIVPVKATTAAKIVMEAWYRPNTTTYIGVRAVDVNGNSSAVVSIVIENTPLPARGTPGNSQLNSLVPKPNAKNVNSTVPPVPRNLKVIVDRVSGIITLSWDPVEGYSSLAGYEIVRSSTSPQKFQGYGVDLMGESAKVPLRPSDIVFVFKKSYTWERIGTLTNRVWNTNQVGDNPPLLGVTLCTEGNCNNGITVYNGETPGASWELVPHPTPVPAALQATAGETCAYISVTGAASVPMVSLTSGGVFASTTQSYYPTPLPSRTYRVSVWLRSDSPTPITVTPRFAGGDHGLMPTLPNITVTSAWQQFTHDWSPNYVYNTSGSVVTLGLTWSAPSGLYVDNMFLYDTASALLDAIPEDRSALVASGLGYLRTHWFIKSSYGYTMASLTNPPGVTEYEYNNRPHTPHTLASVFKIMSDANIKPWLQVEQYHDEADLRGLVEYLAAEYDPAKGDTPQAKPYAFKRYSQNQSAPYTSVFSDFIYEVSNENWNGMFCPWCWAYGWDGVDGVTNQSYSNSQMYGKWQEYTISVLKSSPYWTPAVDKQFRFSLGGWATSDDKYTGFGPQAALESPRSSFATVAGYNGGWDEGETPAVPDDQGFFKALSFTAQDATVHAVAEYKTRVNLSQTQHVTYALGTYEAGPGYNMNGLNGAAMNASQVEAESQVMKSLAGGTSTLDAFLKRAYFGFEVQNFFTFARNRDYWTSHAPLSSGGQAYPCWLGLSLFNVNGTGDFSAVLVNSMPTIQLLGDKRRQTIPAAPLISVYATSHTCTSGTPTHHSATFVQTMCYRVFVLSKKLDGYPFAGNGYTNVTVRLPFQAPRGDAGTAAIRLYSLAGNPRANNLDTDNVRIVEQDVPVANFSPTFVVQTPPGAILMYAFDYFEPIAPAPDARPGVSVAAQQRFVSFPSNASFLVNFDHPVQDFNLSSVVVSGTAFDKNTTTSVDQLLTVEPRVKGSYMTYRINVTNMVSSGTVQLTVAAGAARCGTCASPLTTASTTAFPDANVVNYRAA